MDFWVFHIAMTDFHLIGRMKETTASVILLYPMQPNGLLVKVCILHYLLPVMHPSLTLLQSLLVT